MRTVGGPVVVNGVLGTVLFAVYDSMYKNYDLKHKYGLSLRAMLQGSR